MVLLMVMATIVVINYRLEVRGNGSLYAFYTLALASATQGLTNSRNDDCYAMYFPKRVRKPTVFQSVPGFDFLTIRRLYRPSSVKGPCNALLFVDKWIGP
jgi:hypothetical protein